jgi:hypothetical protein
MKRAEPGKVPGAGENRLKSAKSTASQQETSAGSIAENFNETAGAWGMMFLRENLERLPLAFRVT